MSYSVSLLADGTDDVEPQPRNNPNHWSQPLSKNDNNGILTKPSIIQVCALLNKAWIKANWIAKSAVENNYHDQTISAKDGDNIVFSYLFV